MRQSYNIWAETNRDRYAVGGNTSAEMEAVANQRRFHTGSQ
jgi:hypothetical protein